jgi:hypothetical protein
MHHWYIPYPISSSLGMVPCVGTAQVLSAWIAKVLSHIHRIARF